MTASIMQHTKRILKGLLLSVFWLAVWQLLAVIVSQEIILPTPLSTLAALKGLVLTVSFWQAVFWSFARILTGFSVAVLVGVAGAALSLKIPLFKTIVSPVLHIIAAAPIASFIILALVWFKSGFLPVFICFIMVLPLIWNAVETAFAGIDIKLLEMAKAYRIKSAKVFFSIKLPAIRPAFISSCVTALGFAWKSSIAAEVICRPDSSLGTLLQQAKTYLETPEVFAVTAVVISLSLLLEKIIRSVARRYANDNT